MDYRERFAQENEIVRERYELSAERIRQIGTENVVKAPFDGYFKAVSDFLLMIIELRERLETGELWQADQETLSLLNQSLYQDILPENYEESYGNPAFAAAVLGDGYGQLLSFLYAEIRGAIVFAYENRLTDLTILSETFIEIYNMFEEETPKLEAVRDVLYWFEFDYCDETVEYRIREGLDSSLSFAEDIIMKQDLSDLRYLYRYGEYISPAELAVAAYLNGLPEETVRLMADTYTGGFFKGFEVMRRDFDRKKTVMIRYPLGFERMVKYAAENFISKGLSPIFCRAAVWSVNRNPNRKVGYFGTSPNRQYEYDHRYDSGLYLDKALTDRKLGVARVAYEKYKKEASEYAGPAVIEVFGEPEFSPVNKENAVKLTDKQEQLTIRYSNEAAQIVNQYIPGDETSFTIIAFPMPSIGSDFEQIFGEIIRINTLDYETYRDIQQVMIQALDQAVCAQIRGKGSNETELCVALHPLEDREHQSNFENCVADVNIPVGEVFTSPVLKGTNGLLHVEQVYIGDFQFRNLKLCFRDGMITEYSCSNFEDEEENRRLVKQVILKNHDTLPMGEFAIGTNTTAYAMAGKFGIIDQLPILIAEKMGPHFAVGDTCYSWSEDCQIYNPDGKEVVARDNEISLLRKEDVSKAYFNCHTDITIPYHELDSIHAILEDGRKIPVIEEGRFVLPGTEELNKPLTE